MSDTAPGRHEYEAQKDYIDIRFDEVQTDIAELRGLVMASLDHTHRDKVSWVALMPILGGLVFGLLKVVGF